MSTYDYAIIGGGIVGLSAAMHIVGKFPIARVLLIEKENSPAQHQSGRNSGVIHSGIYYKPGSFKARFAKAGAESMVRFCKEHGILHQVCGKIIVATNNGELPRLQSLYERGLQNGLAVARISASEVREIEPHARCLEGIRVPNTGIVNYVQVSQKLLEIFQTNGGEAAFGREVRHITESNGNYVIATARCKYEAKFIINCAGLYSDRVARLAGVKPGAQIVPFRGEYYELVPAKRHLVRTLIYPVPDPNFPFLGVHFTKMIDGSVHAGPNAVLALKREGYKKTDFSFRDCCETLCFVGFWKLARRNLGEGAMEVYRSLNKHAFVRSLQRLVPEVLPGDLIPCRAGVRAQALMPNGKLVDDFLILPGRNALHICNAPSPAATASLEIGKEIARRVPPLVSEAVAMCHQSTA
jgi:L-2-hydroxyglutarate oxidase